MRIRSNLPAFNAHRHLSRNDVQLDRSLERLSSGLRVNRASDDAAGLTISETLRSQVRGNAQAYKNVQDGLNFCYNVDSRLQQMSGMLQRVRELTVQAGNGTYTLADRQAIQGEINQLLDTIRDITTAPAETNDQIIPLRGIAPNPTPVATPPGEDFVFVLDNTNSPVNGPLINDFITQIENFATQVAAARPGSKFSVVLTAFGNASDNGDTVVKLIDLTTNPGDLSFANLDAAIRAESGGTLQASGQNDLYAAVLQSITGFDDGDGDAMTGWGTGNKNMIVISGVDRQLDRNGGGGFSETQADLVNALNTMGISLYGVGTSGVTDSATNRGLGSAIAGTGGTFYDRTLGLAPMLNDLIPPPPGAYNFVHLQVGANEGQEMLLELTDMTLNALGLSTFNILDGDVGNELAALDAAQAMVSVELGKWGGYESRLQHTASNLTVSQLSQMTAESRIRDLDMADEAVQLARWQVLQQAAVATLGQAQRGGTQRLQALLYSA